MPTILLLLLLAARGADPYAETWARAEALAAEDPGAAAEVLEPLAASYPQDYAVALQIGWWRFQAEEWAAAEASYRRAVALSHGSVDSRRGLAWSLERQGKDAEAATLFTDLAALDPADADAAAGVAATRPRRGSTTIGFQPSGMLFVGDPDWAGEADAAAWIEHRTAGGFVFQASYRYCQLWPTATNTTASSTGMGGPRTTGSGDPGGSGGSNGPSGPYGSNGPGGPGDSGGSDNSNGPNGSDGGMGPGGVPAPDAEIATEHVAHLGFGFGGERAGVLLQGAGIVDGSGGLYGVVALSGRWSPYGDLVLALTGSAWWDTWIAGADLEWSVPLAAGFSVSPGGAVQYVDGTWLGNGRLGLSWEGEVASLWAGGRLGTALRPVLLDPFSVYDLPGRMGPGAWAGGGVALGGPWSLDLDWEWTRLRTTAATSDAHLGALTLRWSR